MPATEYKLIMGTGRQVEAELVQLAMKGWKPILLSSTSTGGDRPVTQITIVLEHIPGAGV
jgi:hypothetical protein